MGRVRLIVYAVAFGIGLVLGILLFRPAAQVPAPGQNAGGAAHRDVAMLQRANAGFRVSPAPSKPAGAPTVSTARPAGPRAVPSPPGSPPAAAPHIVAPPQSPRPAAPSPPASRSSALRAAPPSAVSAHPPTASYTSSPVAAPEGQAAGHDAGGPSSIAVIPPPDDAALPGAQQPAAESHRFHVQVGNFSTAEGAQAFVKRLQALGYVATAPEGDGHRVWVGGYLDRETAERLAANLRKAGFEASIVP